VICQGASRTTRFQVRFDGKIEAVEIITGIQAEHNIYFYLMQIPIGLMSDDRKRGR